MIKLYLPALFLLAIVFSEIATAAPENAYNSGNILSNGSFESGTLNESANNLMGQFPWLTSNSGGNKISVTTQYASDGKYALQWAPIGWNVKDDKTIEDASTFIITNITPYINKGATTAHLKGALNTAKLKKNVSIQIILANDKLTRFNANTTIQAQKHNWQQFDISMPIQLSDTGIFIAFKANNTKGTGSPGSAVYIDDLSLTFTGPVAKLPVPPTPIQSQINDPNHVTLIGLNQLPKYNDPASKTMANEFNLNFIVGITQWLEPTPGQYTWTTTKTDTFQTHLRQLKQQGYKTCITLTNVHMDQKHLPEYLKTRRFNDPYLLERWQRFLEQFLARYGDSIDYLNIGNEVNNYFGKHNEEWDDFLTFFQHGVKTIRRLKPSIKISIVLVESQRQYYWKQIEPDCDLLAITYYTPCSLFTKSPTADALNKNHFNYFANTLNNAIRIARNKPILITEVGCATAPEIDSSPQLQVQFINALFAWLADHDDHVLALSWLAPVDWPYEHTKTALKGYLDPSLLDNEPFMKYLTSLGLKYEDGTPKPGYNAFKNGIIHYRKNCEP